MLSSGFPKPKRLPLKLPIHLSKLPPTATRGSFPMPNPVFEKAQERASSEMTGMSFLEHLEELRRRIIHSILYIVGGFGICWWYHEQIFGLMQKPIVQALA